MKVSHLLLLIIIIIVIIIIISAARQAQRLGIRVLVFDKIQDIGTTTTTTAIITTITIITTTTTTSAFVSRPYQPIRASYDDEKTKETIKEDRLDPYDDDDDDDDEILVFKIICLAKIVM